MANELTVDLGQTGLGNAVTAQLYHDVSGVQTAVGTSITMAEFATGRYSGSVPNGTPAGSYTVVFTPRGTGSIVWDGTKEVLPVPSINIVVPAQVSNASQTPSQIACVRGDTLRRALQTLGSVTSRSKAWFTLKRRTSDLDSAALLQIVEGSNGLLVLNGAAPTDPTKASLTIDSNGIPTLYVDESITANASGWRGEWDVQVLINGDTTTPLKGTWDTQDDVTRATA